ncbi:MAG TPA: chemotaxis protein CheW [Candidatus Acidoferrales bacterium]|nr:chemotaxis protein CheW [Candidatus Acidoferrales bacterium]
MKITPGQSREARHVGRTESVILFVVGSQLFAISANSIHEIRSTDSLSGASREIHQDRVPKVRHTLRRGGEVHYIVNACEHFGLANSSPTLVLVLRGTRVAVLADKIERMDTISLLLSLPRAFRGPERSWYRGLTLIDDDVVPVVRPSGFLTEKELSYLDRAFSAAASTPSGQTSAGDASAEDVAGAVSP